MSPARVNPLFAIAGVPRASGDEPEDFETVAQVIACSPRERG